MGIYECAPLVLPCPCSPLCPSPAATLNQSLFFQTSLLYTAVIQPDLYEPDRVSQEIEEEKFVQVCLQYNIIHQKCTFLFPHTLLSPAPLILILAMIYVVNTVKNVIFNRGDLSEEEA